MPKNGSVAVPGFSGVRLHLKFAEMLDHYRPGNAVRVKAESWMETNAQLMNALRSQSLSTRMISLFVALSVALGIASVLSVSVVQRTREIGILRAMGTTRPQMLRVFLVQGAVVGALGSVLGLLLAVALIWVFTHFVRGSDGLPLFNITLAPVLALRVAAIATVCGVLAAVALPAYQDYIARSQATEAVQIAFRRSGDEDDGQQVHQRPDHRLMPRPKPPVPDAPRGRATADPPKLRPNPQATPPPAPHGT